MKIAVMGTGRIGLVTGAGFADFGHEVTCIGPAPRGATGDAAALDEPGLLALIERNERAGRLAFTPSVTEGIPGTQLVFLALEGGPAADGSWAVDDAIAAARDVVRTADRRLVLALRTAAPVGTCDRIREAITTMTTHPVAVVVNPALVERGAALESFFKPACVIIGADDAWAVEVVQQAYRGVMLTSDRTELMDVRSAELAGYASDALHAAEQAVLDELARLCDVTGADLEAVRAGIGATRTTEPSLRDLRALRQMGDDHDVPMPVTDAAIRASERHHDAIGSRLLAHFGSLQGKRIAVWGLARSSTAAEIDAWELALFARLHGAGATVVVHDPSRVGWDGAQDVEWAADAYAAAANADALVLASDAPAFRQLDLARLQTTMRTRVLVDPRNVWSPPAARAAGFAYYGSGRRA